MGVKKGTALNITSDGASEVVVYYNGNEEATLYAPFTYTVNKGGKYSFKGKNTVGEGNAFEYTFNIILDDYTALQDSYILESNQGFANIDLGTPHPALTFAYDPADKISINQDGIVSIYKTGTVIVTATWNEDETFKEGSKEFTVTITAPRIEVPTFAYSAETAEWDLAQDAQNAELPTLNMEPDNLEVTYSSSDVAVATVNTYGKVTPLAKGTTTITASFNGNENYKEATASYTLTVKDSTPVIDPEPSNDGAVVFIAQGAKYNGTIKNQVTLTESTGPNGSADNICSISISNGSTVTSNQIRWYSGAKLTITPQKNVIVTKITWTDSNNKGGNFNANVGTVTKNGTANDSNAGYWTGESEEAIEITSGGQIRTEYIEVEYTKKEIIIPDPVAPKSITIKPDGGEIDTNTLITIAVDEEATEPVVITYSVDEKTYTQTYETPIKLSEGQHTLYVKASNYNKETGKGGYIEDQATYTVAKGPEQYMIVFSDNGKEETNSFSDIINYIESGKEYVSSANGSYLFKAIEGIKFGSSNNRGSLTLTLTDKGKVNANRIIVKAKTYSGDSSSLQLNDGSSQTLGADYTDYIFELDGSQLSQIKLDVTGKRGYVKAITVDYGAKTVQDPYLSIEKGSEVEKGSVLTISSATEDAKLYGTIGETTLEGESMPYTYTFDTTGEVKVDVTAKKEGYEDSKNVTATYTVYQVAATPTMNFDDNAEVEYGDKLVISSTTVGAKLYGNVGSEVLDGVDKSYELLLTQTGEVKINVVAKADDYRDSKALEATITVVDPEGPSKLIFSETGTIVEAGTEITVTSAGSEKMTLVRYGIDGMPREETVEGDHVSYTVDKMNRRFAVSAEKNGISSVIVDKFYELGNKIELTYKPVKEVVELNDGDKVIIGIMHPGTEYYGFMGGVNTGDVGMPNIKKNASFLYVPEPDLIQSENLLASELPEGVLQLTVEVSENGYLLRTDDGKYLKSSTIQGQSDIVLNDEGSEYNLVYDEEINQVYLVSPNNDTENKYAIQINTQGPIFASYKVNHSAPGQWPAFIFRNESFETVETDYTFALHYNKNEVATLALTDEIGEGDVMNYDAETGNYTISVKSLTGEFSLSIDGEHQLVGHADQALTDEDFHNGVECPESHDPYVYVGSSDFSAENPIRLILANTNNENAVALNTHPNAYHDQTETLTNRLLTVNLKPFEGITMVTEPEVLYYLYGDMTVNSEGEPIKENPSFKFSYVENEDNPEESYYILEVASIMQGQEFRLMDNQGNIYSNGETDLQAGKNPQKPNELFSYELKKANEAMMTFKQSYINLTFYFWPTDGILDIDGTIDDGATWNFNYGNDKTMQSGVFENETHIISTENLVNGKYIGVLYVYAPEAAEKVYCEVVPQPATDEPTGTDADDNYTELTNKLADGAYPLVLNEGTGTLNFYYLDAQGQKGGQYSTSYQVINQTPTGVEGVGAEDIEAVYYNLQGVQVKNPEKGIYIKVTGNKTEKVVL